MAAPATTRRRTAPGRLVAATVLALCLSVVLTACGGDENPGPPSMNTLPTDSATSDSTGVVVTGLPDDVKVKVDEGSPGTSPGGGLTFVSPVYSIGPSGPLGATATVKVELDNALPEDATLVVATRESPADRWTWLPATLGEDQQHAEFTTDHFSEFGVLTLDLAQVTTAFKETVQTGLVSGLSTATKPTCANGKEARKGGYAVASWPRKTLAWCFGLENGKRVLKVVNRRQVPVQVVHAGATATATDSKVSGVWTTWLGILGPGSQATFLAPGGTATYDAELQPEQQKVFTAETDAVAQSVRALYAGVRAIVTQMENFGVKTPTAVQLFQNLAARPQCEAALGKGSAALQTGCLSTQKLTRIYANDTRLIAPLLGSAAVRTFWANRFTFLATQDRGVDTQKIAVKRAKPDFGDLVGRFTGKTRVLSITKEGVATEILNDGASRVIELTYQLSDPEVTGRKAGAKTGGTTTAKALLTRVKVTNPDAIGGTPPKAGRTGTISITNGVVTPPYLRTSYCSRAAAKKCK